MLKKAFLAVGYAAALSSTRLALIGLAPLIAYLLGADGMASWALAVSIAPVFFYIFELGIGRALARFSAGAGDESRKQVVEEELLSLRLLSLPVLLAIAAGVAILAWPALTANQIALADYLFPLCLYAASEAVSIALINLARANNAAAYVLTFRASQGILASAVAATCALVGWSSRMFAAFALAHMMATILGWIYGATTLGRSLRRPRRAEVGTTLRYAAPLTLTDFSWWLRGNAFVVLVAHVSTSAETSLFFLAALVATPLMILMSGVEQALAIDYYRSRAAGMTSRQAGQSYLHSAIFFTGISVVAIVLLPYADWFLPTALAQMVRLVAPFYFASVGLQSCYAIWVKSALYWKKTWFLMCSSLLSSAIGLGVGIVLARLYGYEGLAYAYPVPFVVSVTLAFLSAKAFDAHDIENWSCWALVAITAGVLTYARVIRADMGLSLSAGLMDVLVLAASGLSLFAVFRSARRASA